MPTEREDTADDSPEPKPLDPSAFRLEPEEPATPQPVTRSPPQARPSPSPVVGRAHDGEPVVSTTTVRERQAPASRAHTGTLGPPADWPREAIAYPFRDRAGFAVAVAVVVAADLLRLASPVLGFFAHLAVVLMLLHWQVRAVARTATGDDVAPAFFDPKTVEFGELFGLLALLAYLFPALIVWVIPFLASPNNPVHGSGATVAIVVLLSLAFLVSPVLVLATALADRRLMWPWRSILWVARGPVACLVMGAGWAVALGADALVGSALRSGLGTVLAVSVPLRVVTVALALVGARAIGILGRRYEL